MATVNKFNAFVADVANKVHNLGSDTLKLMLTNVAPVATNAVKADITEIAAGGGYSAGGLSVGSVTSTQTSGVYTLTPATDPVLTASAAVATFRYVVIYNSTPAAGNLIGWIDYGSGLTLASGDTFTVDFLNATTGLLQIT